MPGMDVGAPELADRLAPVLLGEGSELSPPLSSGEKSGARGHNRCSYPVPPFLRSAKRGRLGSFCAKMAIFGGASEETGSLGVKGAAQGFNELEPGNGARCDSVLWLGVVLSMSALRVQGKCEADGSELSRRIRCEVYAAYTTPLPLSPLPAASRAPLISKELLIGYQNGSSIDVVGLPSD